MFGITLVIFQIILIFEKLLGTMMSQVVLFAYQMKLNILRREIVTKILPKRFHCRLSDVQMQCDKKNVSQNFVA